jgi:hypothetical protein
VKAEKTNLSGISGIKEAFNLSACCDKLKENDSGLSVRRSLYYTFITNKRLSNPKRKDKMSPSAANI